VERLSALQSQPPVREIVPFTLPIRSRSVRTGGAPQLHVLVRNAEQLEAAIAIRPESITLDYLDLYGLRPSVERVKSAGLTVRAASPRILKPSEARIVNFLASLDCPILVRATGILHSLRQRGPAPPLIGDFSLNAANTLTAEAYLDMGLERLTPAYDLNASQVAELAGSLDPGRFEAVAYQHLPVFHTEHCVFCRFLSTGTTHRDCGRPCEKHAVALRDAQGRDHPVLADAGCRNTVFGAEAQYSGSHLPKWLAAGIVHYRLEFVDEDANAVKWITSDFRAAFAGSISFRELDERVRRSSPKGITEGSLFVPQKETAGFTILR
jgi:putative protease